MDKRKAIESGSKTYIGKPCIHGHDGKRYTRNSDCIRCRNIAKNVYDRNKRHARGLKLQGKPRKYPELIGPPRPIKKHPPKPVTEFEFWIKRSRTGNASRTQLSIEYYKTLFVTHCPLLNMELTYTNFKGAMPRNYATLDKIDPSKGYTVGNVQIISSRANTIKNDASLEELKTIVKNWESL
jgi:hypothetical protein